MAFLPILKPREIAKALMRAGFYIHHQIGSHARLFHRIRRDLKVTIPMHNRDLPIDTLKRILKQADIEDGEFKKLL
ncbi:MAG: type II toxin-antitoxin system HicA family toxin [bacterium]|nr:type II toxin-antitoxin system HicA family toxin [bacterium]